MAVSDPSLKISPASLYRFSLPPFPWGELIFVVFILGILAFIPGLVRSNKLSLPFLNNLEAPVRLEGFYPTEANGPTIFRWTSDKAKIFLPESLNPQRITLEVAAAYPPGIKSPVLHLFYKGTELAHGEIKGSFQTFEANFPLFSDLVPGPLDFVIEAPLLARKDDSRLLGVAVRLVELEAFSWPPTGVVLTLLGLGGGIFLACWGAGQSRFSRLFVSLTGGLLILSYWQLDRFYGSILVGWYALLFGLLTLALLNRPRALTILQAGKTKKGARFNGAFLGEFWDWFLAFGAKWIGTIFSFLPILIILIVTYLIFGRALDYGYHWDDYHIARPWSLGEVLGTFAGSWDPLGLEPAYFRPLTVISFALNWWTWAFNPFGYHLTNLLLHLGVILLLISLLTGSL